MPLEYDEVQSVREREFGDAFFEILQRLGAKEYWAKGEKEESKLHVGFLGFLTLLL
jgi:hypothetical protein